ncbi:MAG: tyrosine-type recombinase/integrase [Bryobacterales bacterium]|nr:tyrosine-type recombinase/integrase [Bryobacterales bacterium]
MTIREACSTFLDEELRFRNRAQGTIQGYETVFRSLARWATKSGVSYLADLDDRAIRHWIKEWTCRPSTTRQRLAQIKKFFLFAVERGWVPRSPLATVRPPRSDSSPTMPLTVREMRALLRACGQQLKERGLILLMRYSGLAIGDAVTLSREAVVGTELTLRRAKTGELVMVDLPHIVVRAIRSIRGPNPDYFWWSGKGQRVTIAKRWRTRLGAVAARAGVEGFHPHRLRDTFAVALLTAGVSIEDVSSLLGHSSIQTTERHYAPWDRRRRDRLTRVVRAANRLDPLLAEMDPSSSGGGDGAERSRQADKKDQTDGETSLWSSQFMENWPLWNLPAGGQPCRRAC